MLRRVSQLINHPDPGQFRDWYVGQHFADDGSPITDEAAVVMQIFFEDPDAVHSVDDIAQRVFVDPFQVYTMCRQFVASDILVGAPPMTQYFRLSQKPGARNLIDGIRQQTMARRKSV